MTEASGGAQDGIDVKLTSFFWTTFGCGGLMTCGLVAVILWVQARRFPRRMDAAGVETRAGKRYPWAGLEVTRWVNARTGAVLGYDLVAPDAGRIKLAAASLQGGWDTVNYALRQIERAGGPRVE